VRLQGRPKGNTVDERSDEGRAAHLEELTGVSQFGNDCGKIRGLAPPVQARLRLEDLGVGLSAKIIRKEILAHFWEALRLLEEYTENGLLVLVSMRKRPSHFRAHRSAPSSTMLLRRDFRSRATRGIR
jgi:hypothetical protein